MATLIQSMQNVLFQRDPLLANETKRIILSTSVLSSDIHSIIRSRSQAEFVGDVPSTYSTPASQVPQPRSIQDLFFNASTATCAYNAVPIGKAFSSMSKYGL